MKLLKNFFDFSKERSWLFAVFFYAVWLALIFVIGTLLYYFSNLLYSSYSFGSTLTDALSVFICAWLALKILRGKGKKVEYTNLDLNSSKLLIAAAAGLAVISPFYGLLIPAYLSTTKKKIS